jgi:hypothetical protein
VKVVVPLLCLLASAGLTVMETPVFGLDDATVNV